VKLLRRALVLWIVSISLAFSASWESISNGHHSFRRLGRDFLVDIPMKRIQGARLVLFNHRLAKQLGLKVPSDPQKLEQLILNRFAWEVDLTGRSSKTFFATYYQDSDTKDFGEARGDGRMVWTGEIEQDLPEGKKGYLDVTLKGMGQTPLAWVNNPDQFHSDGLQGMDEAVHSFIFSEAAVRNQLDSTVDLAVIELPITKRVTYTKVPRPAAITVRVGNQTRLAHLRNFGGQPHHFERIFEYVMHRDLGLALHKPIRKEHVDRFFRQFVDNLADETARYYDLHAVHGSTTAGNRTTQGSTIDMATFHFLDAHHSSYSYLHNRRSLGGGFGQVQQMSSYIYQLISYVNGGRYRISISQPYQKMLMKRFADGFNTRLERLLLNRLGLSAGEQDMLPKSTRTNFVRVVRKIFEAEGNRDFDIGWQEMTPAAYDAREILKRSFEALNATPSSRPAQISRLFSTDRAWRSANDSGAIATEYYVAVSKILSDLKVSSPKPEWIRHAQEVAHNRRQVVGVAEFEANEAPILESIERGERLAQVNARAEKAIQSFVDHPLPIRGKTQFGIPYREPILRFPQRLKSRATDRAAVRLERTRPEWKRVRREAKDVRAK
jgi:uncharacterized protein YdiU (UPF0061 family)